MRNWKLSEALPISIWAIGLGISYVHIYRAAQANPALAEVAWLIPALFDLLVAYAAWVAISRIRAGKTGWAILWPTLIASTVLLSSLWINTAYVAPVNISEYLMTWSAVIGSFFAYELWRASHADSHDQVDSAVAEAELAAQERIDALRAEHDAELAQLRRTYEDQLAAEREGELEQAEVDELAQRRADREEGEDKDDETRRVIDAWLAQQPDDQEIDRTEARRHLEQALGIGYHAARKRMVSADRWDELVS